MSSIAIRSLRGLRWLVCSGVIVALWACTDRTFVAPKALPGIVLKRNFVQSVNRKLDLLFLVDDSSSMTKSQGKLAKQLPDFMKALGDTATGLPDLHVAVVSSSLGAGMFSDVPGCHPGTPGNDDGAFQHAAACSALNAGETFIKAGPGGNNFTGNLADVFACLALLGVNGCGFEHQLAAVQRALERAANPDDAVNGGFLRPDAYLGVVLLSNEDDCSAPADSDLFNPSQRMLSDELGGLQSYRCNEFGHLCDGVKPPHNVTAPTKLDSCVSAEGAGRLTPVADFVTFLKGVKNNEDGRVFVAALTGPTTSYVVQPTTIEGLAESQPGIHHSCMGAADDFADPAVRIASWVSAFGDHGVNASICDGDFGATMKKIAEALIRILVPSCLTGDIMNRPGSDVPDCEVTEVVNNVRPGKGLPFCDSAGTVLPCWRLASDARCANGKALRVCRDAACSDTPQNVPEGDVFEQVACALAP